MRVAWTKSAFIVVILTLCGCSETGTEQLRVASGKSASLMVDREGAEPCRRMCRHMSDCKASENGMAPSETRGSEIDRDYMTFCMNTCVGKMAPAEVACWSASSCVKAAKMNSLSVSCLPPKPKPKPKPKPTPKPAPTGPTCEAMCAHVMNCPEARPKGLTDAEALAACTFHCEGFEPKVRACYLAAPCIDLPIITELSAQGCAGMAPRDCVDDRLCLDEGQCMLAKGQCIQTRASVAGSRMCTATGRCGGRGNSRECREADVCRDEGRCRRGKISRYADSTSCLASGSGCAKTEACRKDGLCGVHPRWAQCVPTAGGCARSEVCKESGRCGVRKFGGSAPPSYKDLKCVVNAGGCRRSEACKRFGQCWSSPSEFDEGSCVSKGIADCRRICAGASDCTFVYAGRRCVPRSTDACRAMHGGGPGAWIFKEGKCVPQSDAACAQSLACKGGMGKCSHRDGRCVLATDADCARRIVHVTDPQKRTRFSRWISVRDRVNGCAEFGLCAFDGGQCVASAEGCAASRLCIEDGLCTLGPDGCFAATDTDCVKSRLCQRNGACIALAGRCGFRCGNGPKARKCAL